MRSIMFRWVGLLTVGFFTLPAQAVTLDFFCISNTSATNCAAGSSQLTVDATDAGFNGSNNQVLFTFNNAGLSAATIMDVYFDDGSLLGIASLIDADDGVGGDPGVDFSQGAAPPDLPAGNNATPPFQVTAGFLADADVPQPVQKGVGIGESLGIVFDLQGTQTFNDVVAELSDGSLRVGIHVQAFSDGGSESFINNPVPIPAAIWLFGSGLVGLAGLTRRRRS